ncbi:MAG: sugar phosphate nucleotidyltransferase [Patescibacteria group bacterium]|nr:sugar phosphate nucleotidyltransferase [Patescibacteria group bacterium]
MNQHVGCIIPAAGFGSFCPDRSVTKVVADVGNGELMINRIVRTVKQTGVIGSLVVVIGDRSKNQFGDQIRQALRSAGHIDVKFAVQPDRFGAADAVARGLKCLNGEDHLLVTLGDMGAWTSETMTRLIEAHLRDGKAAISLVTVTPPPGDPIADYGRIARDGQGGILSVFEPDEMEGRELAGVKTVNPSLYVFNRRWFENNFRDIKPVSKDGLTAERHLPKLLKIARGQGAKIIEIPVADHNEARGVNNAAQLERLRQILRQRRNDNH